MVVIHNTDTTQVLTDTLLAYLHKLLVLPYSGHAVPECTTWLCDTKITAPIRLTPSTFIYLHCWTYSKKQTCLFSRLEKELCYHNYVPYPSCACFQCLFAMHMHGKYHVTAELLLVSVHFKCTKIICGCGFIPLGSTSLSRLKRGRTIWNAILTCTQKMTYVDVCQLLSAR